MRAGTRLEKGLATSDVPFKSPAFNVISGSKVTPSPPSTICTSVSKLVASTAGAAATLFGGSLVLTLVARRSPWRRGLPFVPAGLFFGLSYAMGRDQLSLADRLAKTVVVVARYKPTRRGAA